MDVELSPQHNEVISALYDVRARMTGISLDERVIVEMAITLLEDLGEYAGGEMAYVGQAARRRSQIRWTRVEYERLICSTGFELIEGRLRPRFY